MNMFSSLKIRSLFCCFVDWLIWVQVPWMHVFWSVSIRIRINKQLDVEPEEPVPLEEEEGEQPKAARRKQKRSRKDSAPPVEAMEEKVRGTEFVVEALPLPGVLMVEVDNVLHEEFQVTEEVKVSLSLA